MYLHTGDFGALKWDTGLLLDDATCSDIMKHDMLFCS